MFGDNLDRIVKGIEKNYEADEIFFTKPGRRFPSRSAVKWVLKDLRRVLFPGYFGDEMQNVWTRRIDPLDGWNAFAERVDALLQKPTPM